MGETEYSILKIADEEPGEIIVSIAPLGIGEETKSQTIQALTREFHAHTVIHSGGCQAGQEITLFDGREIELSHFGAGIFDGASTHLVHFAIFPVYLYEEALKLKKMGVKNPLDKITIDEDVVVVTPYHGAFSRLKERSRGENKHGTVGMGVSEAVAESRKYPDLSIKARDLLAGAKEIERKVEDIRKHKLAQAEELLHLYDNLLDIEGSQEDYDLLKEENFSKTVVQSFLYFADLVQIVDEKYIDEILKRRGAVLCQPTHGALLHPRYGFVPHVTQIDPTGQDVLETLKRHAHERKIIRLGVSRCYFTRQGAGPLVSFSEMLTELHHDAHDESEAWWLGKFRNGYYDLVAIRYALKISGGKESFDGLVISHLDVLNNYRSWQIVEAYTYGGEPPKDLDTFFELKGTKITGIKFHQDDGSQSHYEHQRRLTQLLNNCRPELTTLNAKSGQELEENFIQFVEEKLNLPVVLVSHGPKSEDRSKRPAWNKVFKS